tara:strand:- start:5412 stop:6596 length:1185 start_codon:yes stop_codon:yes gene_type:complete
MARTWSLRDSVLIRVDYNVPLQDGKVLDTSRITASLPTIKYFLKQNKHITLISHLGRPIKQEKKLSLYQIKPTIEKIIGEKIEFISTINFTKQDGLEPTLSNTRIRLLENLRFYSGEQQNELEFARILSNYASIYINDAFGVSHRAHASVSRIHDFFPDKKFKGLLLSKEISELKKIKNNPQRPYTVIVGGSKIGSKIHILRTFLNIADNIIIGGGMAFPFIKYLGGEIGNSIFKESELEVVKEFLDVASTSNTRILFPKDCLITNNIVNTTNPIYCDIMNIPKDYMGVDIGPQTIQVFKKVISQSKAIMWNGPMGISEIELFSNGTKILAEQVATIKAQGGYTLIGGGDTISEINKFGLQNKFTHVSTGGGAMLEFFRNEDLPGVVNLKPLQK